MLLSWKERVAEKRSRLLADSPSSTSPVDSPTVQETSWSTEEFSSPKMSAVSSYLLPLLPTRISSFGGHSSVTCEKKLSPCPSPHSRWMLNGSEVMDKPLELNTDSCSESGSDDGFVTPQTDIVDISDEVGNSSGVDAAEVNNPSHDLPEFLSNLTEKSTFINSELFDFFQSSLPNIVKDCQWVLLYSTLKHGISLHSLFRNSNNLRGPCLLVVGDMEGAIFGGLLDSPLNPTAKRKYQGTNQTFIFTTLYGEPRLFRATGANRYYYLCLNDILAFGGGGSFALCLDEDLLRGTSGPCETFGSLCLAHSPEFELKNVELWGFTHPSRYHA